MIAFSLQIINKAGGKMEQTIVLEPFSRVLSGYDKLEEVAVSVADCSRLCRDCQEYGVEGYRLGGYRGKSYLNRYVNCTVDQAPMLIYRQQYLIPLVFRESLATYRLFQEERIQAFFMLLEWTIQHRPELAIIDYDPQVQKQREYKKDLPHQVIDSAYLAFRLSEILDGSGFPLSKCHDLVDFMNWNRIYKLINNGDIGRHSKLFDPEDPFNRSELKMILKIVQLRYPETSIFI